MISFEEAYETIQVHTKDFGTEEIPLYHGIGRVLREDWLADRDMPPFDRVSMDGIAVNYAGVQSLEKIKIEAVIAAGDAQATLSNTSHCVEIMTGAMLPIGADTVIRYEDLSIENGFAKINTSYSAHQNVHARAKDRQQGELLVPSGSLLSASEIGVAASIGKSEIQVAKQPRTIIISTGNELVEVHEQPAPHQIRRGNVYRMQAMLKHQGLTVDTAHLRDEKEEILTQLKKYIEQYDLIILSGGVSKGKFDCLPDALERCQVRKHFHRVAQRPGKPFWFGTHPSGTTVFALPGNPISSFMCLNIYVIDWLRSCQGLGPMQRPFAILSSAFDFKPDLTFFLEAKIKYDPSGKLMAQPMRGNGSGDLANLCRGDAFIKLPRGKERFEAGEVFEVYWYR